MPTESRLDARRGAPEPIRWETERGILLSAFYGRTDGLPQAEAERLTGIPHARGRNLLAHLVADGYLEAVGLKDTWRPDVLKITEEGSLALRAAPRPEGSRYLDYDGNVTRPKGEQA